MTNRYALVWAVAVLYAATVLANPDTPPDSEAAQNQATELGVRFTPELARAIGKRVTDGMRIRYELDDSQTEEIRETISKRLLKFAHENAETTRDMIELMMAGMIENDGRLSPDAGRRFAALSKPLTTNLQKFFTESAGEISAKMSLKQRLEFTGDIAKAAAGLTIFQSRMKRWEEGKIGQFANPFDSDEGASASTQPIDPSESPELRTAKLNADRAMRWQVSTDDQWEKYVERAVEYYELNEKQSNAAKGILQDCKQRAKAIRSEQWSKELRDNRVRQQLARRFSPDYFNSPVMFALDEEFEKLRQPISDLERELKRRIEGLPTSEQRAAAQQRLKKMLDRIGVKPGSP
jgi:polyhydroxyalkanoate synthesis regulator phasin